MDNTKKLGSEPIGKLLASYSIPAVIAMMVNAIYNVVDRIFIGQYAGEGALAGLTIVFPAMMVIFAFAGLIGVGGASLVSIKLGENNKTGANKVFGNMLGLASGTAIFISLLAYLNLDSLLAFFGADAVTMPFASDYMSIILIGIVFQLVSYSLNGIVRSEGQPILAMVSMLTAAIVNIVLDYVFIAQLGWGVQGAAFATIIGQFIGFVILSQYFIRGKATLKLDRSSFVLDFKLVRQMMSVGFTTFLSTVGTSAAMLILNRSLITYGDLAAITSMGAINSLFTIFIMPLMGIQQGMQPIVGYNHGAGKHGRVRSTIKLSISVGVIFSTIVCILLQVFPETLMSMFLDPSSETMNVAVNGLRLFVVGLPLVPITLLGTAYFQSIAESRKALILGASRQFLFLIPITLIIPQFLGLNGVWLATPISDIASAFTAGVLLYPVFKKSEVDEGYVSEVQPLTQAS